LVNGSKLDNDTVEFIAGHYSFILAVCARVKALISFGQVQIYPAHNFYKQLRQC